MSSCRSTATRRLALCALSLPLLTTAACGGGGDSLFNPPPLQEETATTGGTGAAAPEVTEPSSSSSPQSPDASSSPSRTAPSGGDESSSAESAEESSPTNTEVHLEAGSPAQPVDASSVDVFGVKGEDSGAPGLTGAAPLWQTEWAVLSVRGDQIHMVDDANEPTTVSVVRHDGSVAWSADLTTEMPVDGEVEAVTVAAADDGFVVSRIIEKAEDPDALEKAGRDAEIWWVGKEGAERLSIGGKKALHLPEAEATVENWDTVSGGLDDQSATVWMASMTDGKPKVMKGEPDLSLGWSSSAGWLRASSLKSSTLTVQSDRWKPVAVPLGEERDAELTWAIGEWVGVEAAEGSRIANLRTGKVMVLPEECEGGMNGSEQVESPNGRYLAAGPVVADGKTGKFTCSPESEASHGVAWRFVTDSGQAFGWKDHDSRWFTGTATSKPHGIGLGVDVQGLGQMVQAVGPDGLLHSPSGPEHGGVMWQLAPESSR